MGPTDIRLVRNTCVVVLALLVLRLLAAAWTPLTFDEAYYWIWSKHLAGGYYDHPPMVALVIRAGTLIAGDTDLGVRLVSILIALPMSYAVFRSAELLFGGMRVAATATILLNVTLMVSVGTTIITPDSPLIFAASFVLFFLAKLLETERGAWWLAAGVAVGFGLLSKYTALFFGPAILIWLVIVPNQRRWLLTPWPYLAAVIALAMFTPVILWNAEHNWVSFVKQIGRARIEYFNPTYIAELVPIQFVFATPLVAILGAMGLYALYMRKAGAMPARVLIDVMFWIIALYFVWHSLHARVEANWLAPVYPAFAIAAAVAGHLVTWEARAQGVSDLCLRWASPLAILMFVLLIVQANTGMLSGYRRDPTVRSVGIGWRALAAEIEKARVRVGATCVLAPDYGTASWLAFYLPHTTCVMQPMQRIRWINIGEPDAAVLKGPLLFVDEVRPAPHPYLKDRFATIERIGELPRKRGPLVFETYALDLLREPKGDVLDRTPPPELQ